MYVKNTELSTLIAEWHDTSLMPVRLIEVVGSIARGCRNRYCRQLDPDDAVQCALLKIFQKKHKFDPHRGCFNYMTTIIINEFRQSAYKNRRWASSCEWSDGLQNGCSKESARAVTEDRFIRAGYDQ